jgi:hypothetical protein
LLDIRETWAESTADAKELCVNYCCKWNVFENFNEAPPNVIVICVLS